MGWAAFWAMFSFYHMVTHTWSELSFFLFRFIFSLANVAPLIRDLLFSFICLTLFIDSCTYVCIYFKNSHPQGAGGTIFYLVLPDKNSQKFLRLQLEIFTHKMNHNIDYPPKIATIALSPGKAFMICNFTLKRFFLHQFTAYDLQRHAKP
jgi:hypothetical protein